MSKKVILICNDCLSRNYHTKKNQYLNVRLELKKYCPICNKPTIHKETK